MKSELEMLNDAIETMTKVLNEFFDSLPMYVIRELQHPHKKPRGSIRRKRKYKNKESGAAKNDRKTSDSRVVQTEG